MKIRTFVIMCNDYPMAVVNEELDYINRPEPKATLELAITNLKNKNKSLNDSRCYWRWYEIESIMLKPLSESIGEEDANLYGCNYCDCSFHITEDNPKLICPTCGVPNNG